MSHPPSAERPNLGELREQLVNKLAEIICWGYKGEGTDCISETDLEFVRKRILPIIEQREREARIEGAIAEVKLDDPGSKCACTEMRERSPGYVCMYHSRLSDLEIELAKLQSQPKEGGR